MHGMFIKPGTCRICLDLLYDNGQYDAVLQLYDCIEKIYKEQNKEMTRYLNVFLFAACYKINTPESFQRASQKWNQFNSEDQQQQMRRSLVYFAGLCLNQNDPLLAMQMLDRDVNYYMNKCLRIIGLAQTRRFARALYLLKSYTHSFHQTCITQDLLVKVEKEIRNAGQDFLSEYNEIVDELCKQKLVADEDSSLDTLLDAPFPASKKAFNKQKYTQTY